MIESPTGCQTDTQEMQSCRYITMMLGCAQCLGSLDDGTGPMRQSKVAITTLLTIKAKTFTALLWMTCNRIFESW